MGKSRFRLNRKGVSEVLRKQTSGVINDVAAKVAAAARSQVDGDVPVEVTPYTTDRGAAAVTIAHPKGLMLQAKGGVLTRAASANGLEVTQK